MSRDLPSSAARRAAWAGLLTTALGALQVGMSVEQYFAYHRAGLLLSVALGAGLVVAGAWQFRQALGAPTRVTSASSHDAA